MKKKEKYWVIKEYVGISTEKLKYCYLIFDDTRDQFIKERYIRKYEFADHIRIKDKVELLNQ